MRWYEVGMRWGMVWFEVECACIVDMVGHGSVRNMHDTFLLAMLAYGIRHFFELPALDAINYDIQNFGVC